MKAKYLIDSLLGKGSVFNAKDDFEVKSIVCDSKKACRGSIFVAVKGNCFDAHDFIPEALRRGCRLIITQSPYKGAAGKRDVKIITVKDSRLALSRLCSIFYYSKVNPKVVGITGTNGKTTVSYLIEALVKEAGGVPGVIGTVNYRYCGRILSAKNTTPGPLELFPIIKDMGVQGVSHVAMEASSHALHQRRTYGIKFSSAVFTNLTQDHLDYHGDMRSYFMAKSLLFSGLGRGAFAVINSDDKYGKRLLGRTRASAITYGFGKMCDVRAERVTTEAKGSSFLLKAKKWGVCEYISTRLIGKHNVYNILAAVSWGLGEGISFKVIKKALEGFYFVPGRMQPVGSCRGAQVFIDYAHTGDALKNVLSSLRPLCRGRLILVFGCGGDRDKDKRPKMGRVAGELADLSVVTSDNPRSEDPLSIINCVIKGFRGKNYSVIPERRLAIRFALSLCGKADIVLIAGKGHENYQLIGGRQIKFSDKEEVRKCLK